MSQTTSVSVVDTGVNFTYTEIATNNGPYAVPAGTLIVYQQTPPNTTLQSITVDANWNCPSPGAAPGPIICTYDLSPGQWRKHLRRSIVFTLSVNAGTADGTTILNSATVTSQTVDPVPSNNTSVTTVLVEPAADADLALSMSVLPTPVFLSSNLTYTIQVQNSGQAAAAAVRSRTLYQQVPPLSRQTARPVGPAQAQPRSLAPSGASWQKVLLGQSISRLHLQRLPVPSPIPLQSAASTTDPVFDQQQFDGHNRRPTSRLRDTWQGRSRWHSHRRCQHLLSSRQRHSRGWEHHLRYSRRLLRSQQANWHRGSFADHPNARFFHQLDQYRRIRRWDAGDPATGSTNLQSTGQFEFVTATSAVPVGGGTLSFQGTGVGGGLLIPTSKRRMPRAVVSSVIK